MSQALAEAQAKVAGLEIELAASNATKTDLETQVGEKEEALRTFRTEAAEKGEAIGERDRQIRRQQMELEAVRVEVEAKKGTVTRLNAEIDALHTEIITQNPEKKAQQELAAEALKRQAAKQQADEAKEAADEAAEVAADEAKLAAKAARKANLVTRSIVSLVGAVIVVLGMAVLDLFGMTIPVSIWVGVPALVAVTLFLMPTIRDIVDKVSPHVKPMHYQIGTAIISAVIGALIASWGRSNEFDNWENMLLWVFTFLTYGGIFFLAFKVGYILMKDGIPVDVKEKARLMLLIGVVLLACGIVVTLFDRVFVLNFTGDGQGIEVTRLVKSNHPLFFLVNAVLSTMGIGVAFFVVGILAWIGVRLLGSLSSTWTKSRKDRHSEDMWLRVARVIVVFTSIFVGVVLGWGFRTNGNGGLDSWFMPIGVGVLSTAIFFQVKSKVVESCYKRTYRNSVLFSMVAGAVALASLTAVISFGKVYFEASKGPRFAEAQSNLAAAENNCLAAVRGPCLNFAKEQSDPDHNDFVDGVSAMRKAVDQANTSTNRDQLTQSAQQFQTAGSSLSSCLSRNAKVLLEKVHVYPEPAASAMSTQFFSQYFKFLGNGTIEGVSLHQGPAIQALVMVVLLDYLPVILAIFGWIFASKKVPEVEAREEEEKLRRITGRVVTILSDGSVIIDLRFDLAGGPLEEGDELSVLDEKGDQVGWLTAPEPFGYGAAKCKLGGGGENVKPGYRARIATK